MNLGFNFGFLGSGNFGPPKTGLLAYYKSLVDTIGDLIIDRVGTTTATVQPGRGYTGDGTAYITITGLLTTDTITADSTDVPTCTVDDRLDIASGDVVYGVTITRGGSQIGYYPCAEGSGTIAINASGTLPNGTISDQSIHTSITDGTGFDLNISGYSNRESLALYSGDYSNAAWGRTANTGAITTNADGSQKISFSNPYSDAVWQDLPHLVEGDDYIFRTKVKPDTNGETIRIKTTGTSTVQSNTGDDFPSDLFVPITLKRTIDAGTNAVFLSSEATDNPINAFGMHVARSVDPALYVDGDSIGTASYNDIGNNTSGVYHHFYSYHHGIESVNACVGGSKLANVLSRMTTNLASTTYPLIMVEVGINDCGVTSLAQMKSDAQDIINLGISKSDLLVMFTINESSAYDYGTSAYDDAVAYNIWLKGVCLATDGVQCYDMSARIGLSSTEQNPDYFDGAEITHFNIYGHKAIGDDLISQVPLPISSTKLGEYIDSTSDPISGYQSAVNTTTDSLGNSLQYPGRIKYNLTIVSGTGPADWVVTLLAAPELITALGLGSDFYDLSGVPQNVTWATVTDTVRARFGSKGAVVYSTDQDAATITIIDSRIGN